MKVKAEFLDTFYPVKLKVCRIATSGHDQGHGAFSNITIIYGRQLISVFSHGKYILAWAFSHITVKQDLGNVVR